MTKSRLLDHHGADPVSRAGHPRAPMRAAQLVQCTGRQTRPVSGLLGGEEGGCCGVLIVEHDGAMLASKCEIYQVNSGKLNVEVAVKPPAAETI